MQLTFSLATYKTQPCRLAVENQQSNQVPRADERPQHTKHATEKTYDPLLVRVTHAPIRLFVASRFRLALAGWAIIAWVPSDNVLPFLSSNSTFHVRFMRGMMKRTLRYICEKGLISTSPHLLAAPVPLEIIRERKSKGELGATRQNQPPLTPVTGISPTYL